jgi:hypothetical protein
MDAVRSAQALVAALAAVAGLALPAAAQVQSISCSTWKRLGAEQRSAELDRLIRGAVRSTVDRNFQVDPAALQRCLDGNAAAIAQAFDDACGEGLDADMEALDRVLQGYVADCLP